MNINARLRGVEQRFGPEVSVEEEGEGESSRM